MKTTKNSLLKFIMLCFVIALNSCHEEALIEKHEDHSIKSISLNEFKKQISQENFDKISPYFIDGSNQDSNFKTHSSHEFLILTHNIVLSQNGDQSSYTFQLVEENNSEDKFYNLILTINDNDEIIRSQVYEYVPSVPYDSNHVDQFIGAVRTYSDHAINLDDIFKSADEQCVVDAVGYWECSFGNPHAPGECNGSWFTYGVRLIYGACSGFSTEPELVDINDGGHGTGNGNGPFDPPAGGSSGTDDNANNNATNTQPLHENINYSQEIIDCFATLDISGNSDVSLSQSQEAWLSFIATDRELLPLWNYLKNTNGCSQAAQEFSSEAIDDLMEGAEINYEDHITNKLTNDCAKEIFSQIEDGLYSTDLIKPEIIVPNNNPLTLNFSQVILRLFNDHIADLKIENGSLSNPNSSASTSTFPGGAIIKLSDSYLNNATKLSITRSIIHELVHAYILRQYSMDFTFKEAAEQYGIDNGFNINGTQEEQNRFHHEFMGKYVDAIAFSLYEWDKEFGGGSGNTNVQGPDDLLGWDYYYAMAFGGLFYEDSNGNQVETDSFIALVPSQDDREQIKNIIFNEQSGNSNAQSTTCN